MRCPEFEQRINELVDERRLPSADLHVVGHALHCEPCRQLLAGYELLGEACSLLEAPTVSSNLAQRVLDSFESETKRSPDRLVSVRPKLASAIAIGLVGTAVAVALLFTLTPIPPQPNNPADSFAALSESSEDASRPSPSLAPNRVGERPSPALETAGANNSPPATRKASSHSASSPSTPNRFDQYANFGLGAEQSYVAFVESIAPQFPKAAPVWMAEVAGSFQPVANSLSGALEVLRRTLPGNHEEARPEKPSAEIQRSRNLAYLV